MAAPPLAITPCPPSPLLAILRSPQVDEPLKLRGTAPPNGAALAPSPVNVALCVTELNRPKAGMFTLSGAAPVPFPIKVESRATEPNRLGAEIFKPFFDGVIV